jgi:hypothetical protein
MINTLKCLVITSVEISYEMHSTIDVFIYFKENGRTNTTLPVAARPEQGDLKSMVIE